MPFPFKSPTPHPNPNTTTNNRPRRPNPVLSHPIPYDQYVLEPCGPPFISPWPSARSQSPTTQLRRSFRNFVSSENFARQQRNETLFADAGQRDRAFEKLMRLSRGEEEIKWEIAGFEEGEVECEIVWEGGKWVRRRVDESPGVEVERAEFVEEEEKMDVVEGEKKDESEAAVDNMDVIDEKNKVQEVHNKNDDKEMPDVSPNVVNTTNPTDPNPDPEDHIMADNDDIDDESDWEDISTWQAQVQSYASSTSIPKTKTQSQSQSGPKTQQNVQPNTTTNPTKQTDHSRKDSKECALSFPPKPVQNVVTIMKERGNSVTYIEDVSKTGENVIVIPKGRGNSVTYIEDVSKVNTNEDGD